MNLQEQIRRILREEFIKTKSEQNRDEFIDKIKDNIYVKETPDSFILNYVTFGSPEEIIIYNKRTRNITLPNSRFKRVLELLFSSKDDKVYIIRKLFVRLVSSLKKIERFDLQEELKTKSTNKEFEKYSKSRFNTIRNLTLQDIVDNWDEVSNSKNENIKTIKYFVENPDQITELTYDDRGLEDGYHRLVAMKILGIPRFEYHYINND